MKIVHATPSPSVRFLAKKEKNGAGGYSPCAVTAHQPRAPINGSTRVPLISRTLNLAGATSWIKGLFLLFCFCWAIDSSSAVELFTALASCVAINWGEHITCGYYLRESYDRKSAIFLDSPMTFGNIEGCLRSIMPIAYVPHNSSLPISIRDLSISRQRDTLSLIVDDELLCQFNPTAGRSSCSCILPSASNHGAPGNFCDWGSWYPPIVSLPAAPAEQGSSLTGAWIATILISFLTGVAMGSIGNSYIRKNKKIDSQGAAKD